MESLSPIYVRDENGVNRKVARVENTEGDPGDTIFVGDILPAEPVAGDVRLGLQGDPPQASSPIASIVMYAGATDPNADWLVADGRELSRTTYDDLFAIIGTLYGDGDGSTTFNIPDMRGRVPTGRDASDSDFDTLGETGGAKTHTLSQAEMPSHSHTINHNHTINHDHPAQTSSSAGGHNHSLDNMVQTTSTNHTHTSTGIAVAPSQSTVGGGNQSTASVGGHTHSVNLPNYTGNSGTHSGSSGTRGSGNAHNNLQPYLTVNYIIRVI